MSGTLSERIFVRAKLASAVRALAAPRKCHEKIELAYQSLVGLEADDFENAQHGSEFEALRTAMRAAIEQHSLGVTSALSESVCDQFSEEIYELTLRANLT